MQEIKNSIDIEWESILDKIELMLGKKPSDVNAVLFLVGIQELGQGNRAFTKEQKQDLMHIAVCKVFSRSGFYELEGKDADGWPHWRPVKNIPYLSLKDQERALKSHIIDYFEEEIFQN
jgi:hypothetical protein